MNGVNQLITVGMGEIFVSSEPEAVLSCLGIGSCIALCVYDRQNKVGGIAHIVLPECSKSDSLKMPGKYANTAVPALMKQMGQLGARNEHLSVKLVGGAQMIQAEGFGAVIQMGLRNQEMTRRALAEAGIRIQVEEVGGNQGRSVWLNIDSGKCIVKTAYGTQREI